MDQLTPGQVEILTFGLLAFAWLVSVIVAWNCGREAGYNEAIDLLEDIDLNEERTNDRG